jgi:hypothetical protein
MTSAEFYELIQLPEGVTEQLNEYEKQRKADIPDEIMEKLFKREAWDDGVKELQEFLGEDPYGMNILWEQLYLTYTYSYEEYVKRGIDMKIFADTFGFITRFVSETKDEQGKYKYSWAWWFQRQVTLQEFRIGSLEYEFVDTDGHREGEVHIPSDADMSFEGLAKSVKDFLEFEKEYMPDWVGVPLTTLTWMIMPELEEFLAEGSNILTFRRLFDIEFVDYNQNWYMGWIFPGYSEVNKELPEKTTLHRQLKEHLLSGKKFGVAKGHLVLERVL